MAGSPSEITTGCSRCANRQRGKAPVGLAHKHIQPDSSTGNERPALLLIYSALEYRSREDVFFSQLIFFAYNGSGTSASAGSQPDMRSSYLAPNTSTHAN